MSNRNKFKTGHCPWSGKESERNYPEVREYLDNLPPCIGHPTRGSSGYLNPRDRSRRAVAARMAAL